MRKKLVNLSRRKIERHNKRKKINKGACLCIRKTTIFWYKLLEDKTSNLYLLTF